MSEIETKMLETRNSIKDLFSQLQVKQEELDQHHQQLEYVQDEIKTIVITAKAAGISLPLPLTTHL